MFKYIYMVIVTFMLLSSSISGYAQKVPQGTIMNIPDIGITMDKISKYCPGDMDFADMERQFIVAKLSNPVNYQPLIQEILTKCNPEITESYMFNSRNSEEFKRSSTAVIELMGLLDGYTLEHSSKFTDNFSITRPLFSLLQPTLELLSSSGNLLCFSNFTNVSFIPFKKDKLSVTTDCNNFHSKLTQTVIPKDKQPTSDKIIKIFWSMQNIALLLAFLFLCIGSSLIFVSYKTETPLSHGIRQIYKKYLENVIKKIGFGIIFILLIICAINLYNVISSIVYIELIKSNPVCKNSLRLDYNCVFMNTQKQRVIYDLSMAKASNLPTFYDAGSIDLDKIKLDLIVNAVEALTKLMNQIKAYVIALGIFLIMLYYIISFMFITTISYMKLLFYFGFSHIYFIFKTNPLFLLHQIKRLLTYIFLFGLVNTTSLIAIFFIIQYNVEIGGLIGIVLAGYIGYSILFKRQSLFNFLKYITGFEEDPKYLEYLKNKSSNQLVEGLQQTQQSLSPTYIPTKIAEKTNTLNKAKTQVITNYKKLKNKASNILHRK